MPEPRAITVAAFIASWTLAYTLWRLTSATRDAAAVRDWAWGSALAALGALLNVAQSDLSPWIAMVVANPLMIAGVGLLATGVRRVRRQPPCHALWQVPTLVMLAVSVWWGIVTLSLAHRVLVYCLGMLWLLGWLAVALWPLRRGPLRLAALFVLVPAGLLALSMAVRAGAALGGLLQPVTDGGPLNAFVYLVGAMTFVAMQTGLLLMHQLLVLEDVRAKAERDALTGLLNRHGLTQKLPLSLRGWALIAVDIDHFKHINDQMGHAVGDTVLAFVGETLAASLREGDLAVRMGGEEFCVLLRDRRAEQALIIAERLRSEFERGNAQRAASPFTASFGVAEVTTDMPFEAAWQMADAALYAAKAQGRNRCVLSGTATRPGAPA